MVFGSYGTPGAVKILSGMITRSGRKAVVIVRARQQDKWGSSLYHAMQAAIGHELKAEYEPPKELTPKLMLLVPAINPQRDEQKRNLLNPSK
jgi:hypothetical protein